MEESKNKQIQLSEIEILKLKVLNLEFEKAQSIYRGGLNALTDEICKRVNEKKENIFIDPMGRIPITPDGKMIFKEESNADN